MLSQGAAEFARAWSAEAVWRLLRGFAEARGFARTLYLHLPPPLAEERPSLMAAGDAGAAARYLADRIFEVDPAFRVALRATGPFRLAQAFRPGPHEAIPERAQAALAALRGGAGADGVGTPVFGPGLRNGYVEFGAAQGAGPLTDDVLGEAHWVAQTAHLRLCALAAERQALEVQLAPREAEILAWVARGKSNETIATILGISHHTVDTYLRRIYEKLGVNDRTSAALRGLGTGQIDLIG